MFCSPPPYFILHVSNVGSRFDVSTAAFFHSIHVILGENVVLGGMASPDGMQSRKLSNFPPTDPTKCSRFHKLDSSLVIVEAGSHQRKTSAVQERRSGASPLLDHLG